MKHPYADILIAIAKGEEIQVRLRNGWSGTNAACVFRVCSLKPDQFIPPEDFRVKPATITINGVECEAPVGGGQFALDIGKCTVGLFATQVARDAAFAALIKPFSEHSHEAR